MSDSEPQTRPVSNPYARWEGNFVEQMVRLRESKQMTQTELAKTLKSYGLPFHQQTVQRIESGARPVRLNEAHLIALALGANVDQMTAAMAPDERLLSFEVWSVRKGAGETADEVLESLLSWFENVESLASLLADRIESETAGGGSLTPATRWAFAWVGKVNDAASELYNSWFKLKEIGQNSVPDELQTPVLDVISGWLETYNWPGREFDAGDDSIMDMPTTIDGSDGEHSEAP